VAERLLPAAYANTLAHCAGVAGISAADLLNEVFDFMFHCLSQTDDVKVILLFCVGHVLQCAVQPAQSIDAQFAISQLLVIPSNHRAIRNCFTTRKVQSVVF
jgi:hypothetical protein